MNCKERCWYHAWMRKSGSMLCSFRRGRAGCFGKLMLVRCCLNWGNCIHKSVWIDWWVLFEEPRTSCDSFHLTRGDRLSWIMLCFARVAATLTAWTTYFPSLRHYTFIHTILHSTLYKYGGLPVWIWSSMACFDLCHCHYSCFGLDCVRPAWQYHISTHIHTTSIYNITILQN